MKFETVANTTVRQIMDTTKARTTILTGERFKLWQVQMFE